LIKQSAAMNFLSLLSPRRTPAPLPRVQVPACAEEPAPGCGWYDSSHDLQTGLLVCEHSDPVALARELPLAAWLDLQLLGRLN
jgi:hypothetical protein